MAFSGIDTATSEAWNPAASRTMGSQRVNPSDMIHDFIRSRSSTVSFSEERIDNAAITACLEAARWAPSSFNEQPWSFVLTTRHRGSAHDEMLSCLSPYNGVWARHAPVLLLAIAKLYFDSNGSRNDLAFHDVGLAMGNLMLQATALGLSVHQMGGFDGERARRLFRIPDTHQPVTISAIGYRSAERVLPDDLRMREERQRVRKPICSFVFTECWGKELVT